MKRIVVLFISILISGGLLHAQQIMLSGQVKDVSGEPVPGAVVMITGTQDAATADLDGNFTLTLKSAPAGDATLSVSCLGYAGQVIPIGSNTRFEIVLQDDTQLLEETVVIGYSTIKKKDLTGALSTIGGEDIQQRKTQTISQALQGAIPGVTVTRSNSAPGGEATIRVRGITSMTDGSTDPYILIDGVPGSLGDVNPEDIENLTVLKDAASASIYGSQAAAGVILITTKRAAKGKGGISYSYSLGVDTPTRMPKYMDAVSYMDAVNELKYNDLPGSGWYQAYDQALVENYWQLNSANPDDYPNTDWMALVMKNQALRHSHNVKFTASADKLRSSVSIGLDDVQGLYKVNNRWKRYTARLNNDLSIYNWLTVSTDISMVYVDKVSPHSSPALKMRYMPAIYPAVWSNGNYASGKDGSNIYAALMSGGEVNTDTFKTTGKFQLEAKPVDGLSLTVLYSPMLYFSNSSDFQRQTPYYYKDEATSQKFISEALTTTLEETRGWRYAGTVQAYANYQKKGSTYTGGAISTEDHKDTGGTAYTGGLGSWLKGKAFKEQALSTGEGGKGTAMTPAAGATYYLKEVPEAYLKPYMVVIYDTHNNNSVVRMYLLSAVDDLNYSNVGLDAVDITTGDRIALATSYTITNEFTGNATITARTITGSDSYSKGLVAVWQPTLPGLDKDSFAYQAYFVTPDNVTVYGKLTRTVSLGDRTVHGGAFGSPGVSFTEQ